MQLRQASLLSLLLSSPLLIHAKGQLGFAVGNTNTDGTCKTSSDYTADFKAIKSSSSAVLIRTYSDTDQWGNSCKTAAQILPAAKSAGYKVVIGIWPDGGAYNREKSALQAAKLSDYSDTVYGITVGSEGIYRGTYSVAELESWIADIKSTFPNFKVGTADSWNSWANGTMDDVIRSSSIDLALANGFAYWQYQPLSNATRTFFDDMSQALSHIQEVSGSLDKIHFMNGETGWPGDGGTDAGAAKAGTKNAASYWKSAVCGLLNWGVDLFWFEAFDEPQKPDAIGDDGKRASEKTWGSFTADRTPKFDMGC